MRPPATGSRRQEERIQSSDSRQPALRDESSTTDARSLGQDTEARYAEHAWGVARCPGRARRRRVCRLCRGRGWGRPGGGGAVDHGEARQADQADLGALALHRQPAWGEVPMLVGWIAVEGVRKPEALPRSARRRTAYLPGEGDARNRRGQAELTQLVHLVGRAAATRLTSRGTRPIRRARRARRSRSPTTCRASASSVGSTAPGGGHARAGSRIDGSGWVSTACSCARSTRPRTRVPPLGSDGASRTRTK